MTNKCYPRKCVVCGKVFDYVIYGGDSRDVCSIECSHKKFWLDIIDEKDRHVVVDGCCYFVGDENSLSSFRGFGGEKFKIKMLDDGKIIDTTNLWYNGEIPEEFRDRLPDNAEFI